MNKEVVSLLDAMKEVTGSSYELVKTTKRKVVITPKSGEAFYYNKGLHSKVNKLLTNKDIVLGKVTLNYTKNCLEFTVISESAEASDELITKTIDKHYSGTAEEPYLRYIKRGDKIVVDGREATIIGAKLNSPKYNFILEYEGTKKHLLVSGGTIVDYYKSNKAAFLKNKIRSIKK